MATANQQEQDRKDFADEFDATDAAKTEQSEDEAFGLGPEAAAAPAAAGPEAPAPEPAAAADPAPEPEAGAEQAKADEQATTDATEQTANVDETQTSVGADGAEPDPETSLAEDFGPEFVALITKLVKKICKEHVGESTTGLQSTVDALIEHLNTQSHQAHFKTIAAVHADFQELVASPEFEAYRAAQPPAEQADIDRVVASGSSQEIIDMLTKFKEAKEPDAWADEGVDAAEGVRSGGDLRLPDKAPAGGSYEDTWNEM